MYILLYILVSYSKIHVGVSEADVNGNFAFYIWYIAFFTLFLPPFRTSHDIADC